MGGCGTYSVGKTPENIMYKTVDYTYSVGKTPENIMYKTVDYIHGVKVIRPIDDKVKPKLPEESNTSNAYILLFDDGTFHQYREYDKNHKVILEIGYHEEKRLSDAKRVLHIHRHTIPGVENHPLGYFLTPEEIKKYSKFWEGRL